MTYEELALELEAADTLEKLIALERSSGLEFTTEALESRNKAIVEAENASSMLEAAAKAVECVESSPLTSSSESWKRFSSQLARLHAEEELLLAVCETACNDPHHYPKSYEPFDVLADPEKWSKTINNIAESLAQLQETAEAIQAPSEACKENVELLDELRGKGAKSLNALRVAKGSNETQTKQKQKFLSHLSKLNAWAEKQVVNLEAMHEDPADLQAFAFDFVGPCGDVTHKLVTVFESIAPFALYDDDIVAALQSFHELWFYLLDSLVHRLSCLMCELHDTKPLEELLQECVSYLRRLPVFVRELKDTTRPSVGGSSNMEFNNILAAAEGLSNLEDVLKAWREHHALLQSILGDFREMLLSRLTFVPSDEALIMQSVQRQQEYESVVGELRTWAEEESHAESWREVYSSIVTIKNRVCDMMEKEQREFSHL
eukprot:gene5079-3665_t